MSYARLTTKQKVLAQEISDMMAEAKTIDADDDARFGPGKRGDELPVELANRQRRAASMTTARASLEEEAQTKARAMAEKKATDRGDDDDAVTGAGDTAAATAVPKATAQRNFTNPDARLMKTADGSFHYCHNAQAVVDADQQVIIAAEQGNSATDIQQLVPMITTTVDTVGVMPQTWGADAGYCSAANLEHATTLEAAHQTEFFISTRRMKHGARAPDAPQGPIPADATPTDRMARRLKTKCGKEIYARRKAIVEPVSGQLHTRHGKHVQLRGLDKTTAEWKLLAGCHNLLKLFTYRTQMALPGKAGSPFGALAPAAGHTHTNLRVRRDPSRDFVPEAGHTAIDSPMIPDETPEQMKPLPTHAPRRKPGRRRSRSLCRPGQGAKSGRSASSSRSRPLSDRTVISVRDLAGADDV